MAHASASPQKVIAPAGYITESTTVSATAAALWLDGKLSCRLACLIVGPRNLPAFSCPGRTRLHRRLTNIAATDAAATMPMTMSARLPRSGRVPFSLHPMRERGRSRLFIALIALGAAAVYIAGNGSVSLFDRDEPRYAQCSRQMLQSGDWVVPRLFDEVRTAKPVFIYWCQAAAMKMLGDTAFAARLPSALAMPVTLIGFAAFVWRVAGQRRAGGAVVV